MRGLVSQARARRAATVEKVEALLAADVDRVYGDVTTAGHAGHKEPWDAFWGQRYAQVRDPDGNIVDLFASL